VKAMGKKTASKKAMCKAMLLRQPEAAVDGQEIQLLPSHKKTAESLVVLSLLIFPRSSSILSLLRPDGYAD
jgi:hypothetical protein